MPRHNRLDRVDLLSKAVAVIRRNGYRETSLEDLAKEFNFTKPALYYYVDSKEALLYEIYDKTIDEWLGVIKAINDNSTMSPDQKIREVVRQFTHLCVDRDEMAVFFSEKAYLSDHHFQAISVKEREVVDIIAAIVSQGVELGVMKPMSAKVIAYGLVGMTAWSYRWIVPDGALSVDEIADTYYKILSQGFMAD